MVWTASVWRVRVRVKLRDYRPVHETGIGQRLIGKSARLRAHHGLSSECRAGFAADCPLCYQCRQLGRAIWAISDWKSPTDQRGSGTMHVTVPISLMAALLFAIAPRSTIATDLGECSVGKVAFEVSADATPEARRALGVFSTVLQLDGGSLCETVVLYKAEGNTVTGRIIAGSYGSIPRTDKSFSARVRGDGIIQTTIRYTSQIITTYKIATIPPASSFPSVAKMPKGAGGCRPHRPTCPSKN